MGDGYGFTPSTNGRRSLPAFASDGYAVWLQAMGAESKRKRVAQGNCESSSQYMRDAQSVAGEVEGNGIALFQSTTLYGGRE